MTDITTQTARAAQGDNPARPAINAPTNATFKITDTKLYVSVVTLSTENDKTLLEQLKTGFKRTIKWNKYRSEMTNQTKTNYLNYLIDPTFTKVNRLFVLSFENEEDRTSFSKYYVPKVEIKDFNVLIDGKSFFDVPVKNKEEAYEKIMSISKNNDYTTGNLLDYEYFSKYYKLIAIDLSKQIELENPDLKQQINFIGRLEREGGATMFFIIEKSEETTFEFSQNAATVVWFWLRIKMETQKIVNLLGDANNESSKFATRKWYVINDQNNTDYGEGNEDSTTVKFETKVIKSNLCDYSDAYVLVTGNITATSGDANDRVAFKYCAPFTKCITHINDELVDNVDDLDIIMPMYNLIEYSDNYSDTSGSLWQFKRDELPVKDGNPNNVSTANSTSFKYKSSFIRVTTVVGRIEYLKT